MSETHDIEAKPPLVSLKGVGIWYRLHQRSTESLKHSLLQRKLIPESRTFWALRDIDLECHEGQVLGIIGHNGAGKSTLCMTIARILTPDEGKAEIRGQVTPLLSLGSGFHQEMTGRANIFLYAAFMGISRRKIEERMEDIIEFSELGTFIDEPIYTYSSGMRARLGFSVAAMVEPEIMILDEVLGVGDRAFRAKSRSRILEMMKISKLILIVSHSSSFLRSTCTHCLWLEKGRVFDYGEAGPILDAYDAEFDDRAVKAEQKSADRKKLEQERADREKAEQERAERKRVNKETRKRERREQEKREAKARRKAAKRGTPGPEEQEEPEQGHG